MLHEEVRAAPRRVTLPRVRLSERAYWRLTLATAVATWVLIVLGGIVRATDSGLGCATWPMCDGSILPKLEYHQLIEWNHRLFATMVGGLMMATVSATLLWYRGTRRLLWLALFAGVSYIAQAVLGGVTVILKLPPTWIAAHMGNSMLLLASLILLALFSYQRSAISRQPSAVSRQPSVVGGQAIAGTPHSALRSVIVTQNSSAIRWLALGTTLWTYVAMFTGSAIVGADADTACPAWPVCAGGQWLPETLPQLINFGHRVAVGFSDLLLVALAAAIFLYRRDDRRLMRTTHVLAALYIGQVILGAFTIWTGAPPAMKSAHLALAAAVWGVLVLLTAFVWLGPAVSGQWSVISGQRPGVTTHHALRNTHYALRVRLYMSLMKPKVIPLLLVPTVAAMLIAAMEYPVERALGALIFWTCLGGVLATGGAHAINHYLDRDIDARMKRTRNRPVVTGSIEPGRALAFGAGLTALAFVELLATVNLAAAALALGGNLFYVFVYTLWLKRTSTQNIVIGGAAGAVPPLVGWAAVTGRLDLPALLFFAVIFFWTPAHFWALALVRQEDYRAAGIPMLPVVRGGGYTRASILAYTLLLSAVTLLLFVSGALGDLYLVGAVVLSGAFVLRAVQLVRQPGTARAWNLFKFSNAYLALLYLLMVADRVVTFIGGGPHGI
ncbi:MAG: heme o synthase [Chloroflexia bacterium]